MSARSWASAAVAMALVSAWASEVAPPTLESWPGGGGRKTRRRPSLLEQRKVSAFATCLGVPRYIRRNWALGR